MTIENKDITFIVSGKIFHEHFLTGKCLTSIKKFFPKSKIILTTWEGEDTALFSDKYDICIYEKRPASVGSACVPACSWYPKENSYNLQQLLNSKALEQCQTKYVCKFRTDFIFTHNSFVLWYEKLLNKLHTVPDLFTNRVLITSCGTINPKCLIDPMPHHPSDLFFFGLTEDIKKIYDGRFISYKLANWYTLHKNQKNPLLFNHLYTPEQFLWLQLLDKENIKYSKPKTYYDISKKNSEQTLCMFLKNFIILDWRHLSIKSKFNNIFYERNYRFLMLEDFLSEYIRIKKDNNVFKIYKCEKLYNKLQSKKRNIKTLIIAFMYPINSIFKYIKIPFQIINRIVDIILISLKILLISDKND